MTRERWDGRRPVSCMAWTSLGSMHRFPLRRRLRLQPLDRVQDATLRSTFPNSVRVVQEPSGFARRNLTLQREGQMTRIFALSVAFVALAVPVAFGADAIDTATLTCKQL